MAAEKAALGALLDGATTEEALAVAYPDLDETTRELKRFKVPSAFRVGIDAVFAGQPPSPS